MDSYKKIIKNKHTRDIILYCMRFIPDSFMLRLEYRIKLKRKLNLKNPIRFTEKIQLYKLKHRTEKMVRCSDKYLVRDYIREKGLENILIEHYGVFDSIDQIDFENLPNKFVLKLSNGSGTNYICRDKSQINIEELKTKFKKYDLQVKSNAGREWPYLQSKSVIVAEKLLEDTTKINNAVNDYKILCYDGKPRYIICISNRYTEKVNHLVYDINWRKIKVSLEGGRIEEDEPKPDNLDDMLLIAETLSEGFPFSRIDLYYLNGDIYFGEITFFPWSGFMEFEPDKFDYILGEDLHI